MPAAMKITCLRRLGALATGKPAIRPEFVQLNAVRGQLVFTTPRRTGTAGNDRDGRREFLAPSGPQGPVAGARVSLAPLPT